MHNDKFIAPFIAYIKEHMDFKEHFFIVHGGVSTDIVRLPEEESNILILDDSYTGMNNFLKFNKIYKEYSFNAEKIFLHAIFSDAKLLFLFLNQRLLPKCYWVIWGADLYIYNKSRNTLKDKLRHYMRQKVYSKIGHLVTYVKGDYELAQQWYGARGEYHECFMYPSNLYNEYDVQEKMHDTINIQIGNSADPTNNHLDILGKLKKYRDENIKIFAPLSYGNMEYAQEIADKGKEIFGDKFVAMLDFMPLEKYFEFLGEIDIAIFAHKRQQAMGNTITLLGLGKKVYMRNDVTPFKTFEDIDVKVFDVENIDIDLIDEITKEQNIKRIKEHFSKENYLKQLTNLFGGKQWHI